MAAAAAAAPAAEAAAGAAGAAGGSGAARPVPGRRRAEPRVRRFGKMDEVEVATGKATA